MQLDERIAAAFNAEVQSQVVAKIIADAEAAAKTAGDEADKARERALDPALSSADVMAARRDMEDAAFRRDRLQVAVTKLGDRLREVRHQEEENRRWTAYNKASAERDILAAEFKATYPEVVDTLVDLLSRINANDEELARINQQDQPSGAPWLISAELIARGLNGFRIGATDISRITKGARLPSLEGNNRNSWPVV